jgi:hypothetical protein
MSTEDWFKKFANLEPGDVVSFGGLPLVVYCVAAYGGCTFTCPSNRGGEVVPVASPLWDTAEIIDKGTVWIDPVSSMSSSDPEPDEQDDGANWWKK